MKASYQLDPEDGIKQEAETAKEKTKCKSAKCKESALFAHMKNLICEK